MNSSLPAYKRLPDTAKELLTGSHAEVKAVKMFLEESLKEMANDLATCPVADLQRVRYEWEGAQKLKMRLDALLTSPKL